MFLIEVLDIDDMDFIEDAIDMNLFSDDYKNPCLIVGGNAYACFKKYGRDYKDKTDSIYECHCIVEALLSKALKMEFVSDSGDTVECHFLGLMYGRLPVFAGEIPTNSVYLEEMEEKLVNSFSRFGLK